MNEDSASALFQNPSKPKFSSSRYSVSCLVLSSIKPPYARLITNMIQESSHSHLHSLRGSVIQLFRDFDPNNSYTSDSWREFALPPVLPAAGFLSRLESFEFLFYHVALKLKSTTTRYRETVVFFGHACWNSKLWHFVIILFDTRKQSFAMLYHFSTTHVEVCHSLFVLVHASQRSEAFKAGCLAQFHLVTCQVEFRNGLFHLHSFVIASKSIAYPVRRLRPNSKSQ